MCISSIPTSVKWRRGTPVPTPQERSGASLKRHECRGLAPISMKKLINEVDDVVKDALAGMEALHPELLRVDYENQIIVRADAPVRGKVGVISGGGSGHEPMHGGFVGRGMLDAACPGAVFTSPVPDQMAPATP